MFSRISRSVAPGEVQRPEGSCRTIDRGRSGKSRSPFTNGALLPSNNKLQTGVALKKKRRSSGLPRVHRFPASLDHCSPCSGSPFCILYKIDGGLQAPTYCAREFVSVTRCKIICWCTLRCFVSRYVSMPWRGRVTGNVFLTWIRYRERVKRDNLSALPVSRNRIAK